MPFGDRLAAKRKERGYTQQQLAELVDVHVTQLRRYESGAAKPTLDVLRRVALSLQVSIDSLAFDDGERGPDDELRLQFEAIAQFDPEEKQVARSVLEGLIIKHDSQKWNKTAG
ncbi:MAG: helix-turn-helix domain-containing protein [Epibacterium sp.]|nr:helix-turn-helix domain-containing protein [Epibacterium sp.]